MFFEIACARSNNKNCLLREARFFLQCEKNNHLYYRKTVNNEDGIIQKCFIIEDMIVTHSSNPKLFNNCIKMDLRNKCIYPSMFLLSNSIINILKKLQEDKTFLSFSYSEDFANMQTHKIGMINEKAIFVEFNNLYIVCE